MFSNFAPQKQKMKQMFAAFTLGLVAFGTPLVAFAQVLPPPPPPPPPNVQQPPPNVQQPPPAGTNLLPPPPPPPFQRIEQQPTPPAGTNVLPPPPPPPFQQVEQQPPPPPPPPARSKQQPSGPSGYTPPLSWGNEQRPKVLPYMDNGLIPPGYKVEERVRKGLVISGSIIFGLFYLGSVFVGMDKIESSRAPYGALLLPVLGPFVVAGNLENEPGAYLFNGFVQVGSAVMLLAGIFSKQKVLVREDMARVVRPEVFIGPGSVGMKLTF